MYSPTIYFPLLIKECMLIEPTESESKETLDTFVEIMKTVVNEIEQNPQLVRDTPHQNSLQE
ncbi:hypothetical protein PHSC3_000149 [Chlamydiales bacterium STE3]|nr:hypothetical protein PHSC3_000149 [Chlamydiales bacterium STE3]